MKTLIRSGTLALMLWAGAASPVVLAGTRAQACAAESPVAATTLNLSAYGETQIAPDMATIRLGVTTEAPTAAEALGTNATRMESVVDALKRGGIAARDIQTSGLNLNPRYRRQRDQPPQLTGYQTSNTITVRVRDLARLGPALDATVSAGANQVHGISFGLADPTSAENAAREAAVKALADKAELYARATGYRISHLASLSENGGGYPSPLRSMEMVSAQRIVADTPVSPGELTVRVNITGLYELAR